MTWPRLEAEQEVVVVLGEALVVDRLSGAVARADPVSSFVLSQRSRFEDLDDAASAVSELFSVERATVVEGLSMLGDELASLRSGPASPAPPWELGPPSEPDATSQVSRSLCVEALGVAVEVSCHGSDVLRTVVAVLAALPTSMEKPVHRFVVWRDELWYVTLDGRLLADRVGAADAMSDLISGITAISYTADRPGVLVHAAAVMSERGAVVLGGGPNQAKSSTTVELLRRGFNYLTDEVVEISPREGEIRGLSRPIGIVGQFQRNHPELQPSWLELDDPAPRWLVDPQAWAPAAREGALELFVLLRFDGSEAAMEPLTPIDALAQLWALSFNRSRLTPTVIRHLGDLLARTPSFVLRHDGAASAAAVIDRHLADRDRSNR